MLETGDWTSGDAGAGAGGTAIGAVSLAGSVGPDDLRAWIVVAKLRTESGWRISSAGPAWVGAAIALAAPDAAAGAAGIVAVPIPLPASGAFCASAGGGCGIGGIGFTVTRPTSLPQRDRVAAIAGEDETVAVSRAVCGRVGVAIERGWAGGADAAATFGALSRIGSGSG